MKKFLLTTAMVMGAILFNIETKAQVKFGISVNIGNRPSWGLPGNYAGNYYYMPEIDTYYDIPHRQFIYYQGNNWVFASSLPYAYRNYDLKRGYKVMINEQRPYLNHDVYRAKYNSYYNNYHRNNRIEERKDGYNNRFNNGRNDDRDNNGRNDDHDNKGRDHDRDDHNDRDRNQHGRG